MYKVDEILRTSWMNGFSVKKFSQINTSCIMIWWRELVSPLLNRPRSNISITSWNIQVLLKKSVLEKASLKPSLSKVTRDFRSLCFSVPNLTHPKGTLFQSMEHTLASYGRLVTWHWLHPLNCIKAQLNILLSNITFHVYNCCSWWVYSSCYVLMSSVFSCPIFNIPPCNTLLLSLRRWSSSCWTIAYFIQISEFIYKHMFCSLVIPQFSTSALPIC